MSENNLLSQVEKEIAQLLLTKLEHLDISLERVSQIARFVLQTLPEDLTDEQVQEIIPKLDDEFYELVEIVNKHMSEYEEKYKPIILEEVRKLTQEGNFDQASKLMQDYFTKITNTKVAQSQPV